MVLFYVFVEPAFEFAGGHDAGVAEKAMQVTSASVASSAYKGVVVRVVRTASASGAGANGFIIEPLGEESQLLGCRAKLRVA